MNVQLNFKRAKRVIALHYGVNTEIPKKLCKLFVCQPDLDKRSCIYAEAERILKLRADLGYLDTCESIDQTRHERKVAAMVKHTDVQQYAQPECCLICKQSLRDGIMAYNADGWAPHGRFWYACSEHCQKLADFFYLDNGSKKGIEHAGFKRVFGKSLEHFEGGHAIDCAASYMLSLSSYRKTKYA